MKILSHRGFWQEPDQRNTLAAFARSLNHGFGLETDVRDHEGRLVISHDVPKGGEPDFHQVLRLFHCKHLPLALNIKADGLADLVNEAMSSYQIEKWFAFDMSIPDMRSCLDRKVPVFARASEVENDPPWIEEVVGIWFDSFAGDNYDAGRIAEYLHGGKQVCIVSPELHKRPWQSVWRSIEALSEHAGLMLCTDHPEQARQFFTGNQSGR